MLTWRATPLALAALLAGTALVRASTEDDSATPSRRRLSLQSHDLLLDADSEPQECHQDIYDQARCCGDKLTPCAHGTCVDNSAEPALAEGFFLCACAAGWGGADCTRDVDECASAPCVGGSCVESVAEFECKCESGWSGELCEVHDACVGEPCKNGGRCHNSGSASSKDFLCSCPRSWTGLTCETAADACLEEPCAHGGVCTGFTDGSFECVCQVGWTGGTCARKDACATKPCGVFGTCTDNADDSFACECEEGWAGASCADDVDECASTPCPHKASCADSSLDSAIAPGSYACTCAAGWTGDACEEDVDECSSNPCQVRSLSSCAAMLPETAADSFICGCLDGWSGELCDQDVDECASKPCAHGVCTESNAAGEVEDEEGQHPLLVVAGMFQCSCELGWAGVVCDENVDDCASRPCGAGACSDLVDGYKCTCAAGNTHPQCADAPGSRSMDEFKDLDYVEPKYGEELEGEPISSR